MLRPMAARSAGVRRWRASGSTRRFSQPRWRRWVSAKARALMQKRMRQIGNVEIPQSAFLAALKMPDE